MWCKTIATQGYSRAVQELLGDSCQRIGECFIHTLEVIIITDHKSLSSICETCKGGMNFGQHIYLS